MKKIKIVIFCFLFLCLPKMVYADDFGLGDDYLYYCKYDLNTGDGDYSFYAYVFPTTVVPIVQDYSKTNFYDMTKCDGYQCIFDNEVLNYQNMDSFFSRDVIDCPDIYVSRDGYGDYISAFRQAGATSFQSVEFKKGNGGASLPEMKDGPKFTKTVHFGDESPIQALRQETMKISFYYNSRGDKCLEVNGSSNCNENPDDIMVPLRVNGVPVTFRFDEKGTGSKIYNSNNNSYTSFTFNNDIFVNTIVQNHNEVIAMISLERDDDNSAPIYDGEGDKSGGQQGYNPGGICEGDNCNISLDSFCNMSTVARTLKFLGLLFSILKILVPTIIIVIGFVNLFKIITSGKYEDAKKYSTSIFKRVLIGVLIFLLPEIIYALFNAADSFIEPNDTSKFSNCVDCVLKPDNCVVNENNND